MDAARRAPDDDPDGRVLVGEPPGPRSDRGTGQNGDVATVLPLVLPLEEAEPSDDGWYPA